MKWFSVLLGVLLTVAFWAIADDQFKIKVKVTVEGSVEASSFITRELRSLGDVEIVTTNQDYHIDLAVLETKTVGNVPIGFALSLVIMRANSFAGILGLVTNQISDDTAHRLMNATAIGSKDLVWVVAHDVRVCGPDDLRKTCERIVATFDSKELEPNRKSLKQIQNLLKETASPAPPSNPLSQGLGPRRMTNSTPTSP